MKITIDIPEEEIEELAKKKFADYLADNMIRNSHYEGRIYRNMIKEVVRECIKSDIDHLSDRAVMAASKSIENRAVKKLLEKLEDQ